MAEQADARDLKSREILSRTGSTPASGTNYIAEWSSLVARRAHNPKVMRFKSHLRNQKNSGYPIGCPEFFLLLTRTAVGFEPCDLRPFEPSLWRGNTLSCPPARPLYNTVTSRYKVKPPQTRGQTLRNSSCPTDE